MGTNLGERPYDKMKTPEPMNSNFPAFVLNALKTFPMDRVAKISFGLGVKMANGWRPYQQWINQHGVWPSTTRLPCRLGHKFVHSI